MTIIGSIGIFGLIPNVKGLSDKLGINPQSVSTNPAADFPTLFTPMDEKQLSIMQKYVETGYDRFIKRVATGRKMTEAKVRQIAEGRVWNAMKAKEIGLVDELGSLKDAIEWTAKKADIYSKYDVSVYPVYEPSFWDVISMGDIEAVRMMKAVSDGDFDEAGMHIAMKILSRSRILARMPEFEVTED